MIKQIGGFIGSILPGGNSHDQGPKEQPLGGLIKQFGNFIGSILPGGNSYNQGQPDQPNGGLIKQIGSFISSILPGGNQPKQGQQDQPQKISKISQDKNQGAGPTYCDYFPYVPSCQNGGTGPDFALPGVGSTYCDYFPYATSCQDATFRKLQDFIDKIKTDVRNGEIIGDTDGNKGECVGLVQVWLNYLGFSREGTGPDSQHVWGHAKDLLKNADKDQYKPYYDVIYKNTTTDLPVPGDVIVWDGSKPYTQGHGHTAVVISADPVTGTFEVFEQNAPKEGNPPTTSTYHNYDHVSGWLHPKV